MTTNTETLSRARNIRELIESEADNTESSSTMTQPVVDALVEQGLFKLIVPECYGGLESNVSTVVDVTAELSFADGSTGWAFAQNTTVMGYAAYLAPEYAKPLAESRAAAGMFAPLGVANQQQDSYSVSGNYQFGSGSGHAEYMGGAALVMVDGEMAPFENDKPQIIGFIVPSENVEMKGNWDVMGLRGTGSYDFEVPEQSVDHGMTFSVFNAETLAGGAMYNMGPVSLGTISSCGWCIGVARRALHEISEIANAGRARLGSEPLGQQQVFQRNLGQHTTAVEAANNYVKHAYQQLVDALENKADENSIAHLNREARAAGSWAVRIARDAVTFAWQTSGSAGMRNPSILQRCFRDICTGAGHQVFDERNYEELVKTQLGLVPAGF